MNIGQIDTRHGTANQPQISLTGTASLTLAFLLG